jgi:hypothetical protein
MRARASWNPARGFKRITNRSDIVNNPTLAELLCTCLHPLTHRCADELGIDPTLNEF